MRKAAKMAGLTIAAVIGAVLVGYLIIILILTVTEYKPEATEPVETFGQAEQTLHIGDTVDVVAWNIGFCGLGDNADFFMDGGKKVKPSTKERVEENLSAIIDFLAKEEADLLLLQEVDEDTTHSYYIDERSAIASGMEQAGLSYENYLAYNFKTLFVPYPIPPVGKEQSGIATYSAYPSLGAERVSLPCPFSYPVRLANLKRCLLVSRIPVEGSGKELVVINLHLEAYDDGEGKEAQTKMLAQLIEEEINKGNYVVAGGDFNQSFDTIDLSSYPHQREDLWEPGIMKTEDFIDVQCLMDVSVPSCRSLDRSYDPADPAFQYYMLDGFLVSSNIKVEQMETVDLGFKHADHNPLRLKITLE